MALPGVPPACSLPESKLSNFAKLRADEGLRGDLKEVVLADILYDVMRELKFDETRFPTDILWHKIALLRQVRFIPISLGKKVYTSDGLTNNANVLKIESPKVMTKLYKLRLYLFWKNRYSSLMFFLKSFLGFTFYSLLTIFRCRR